MNSTTTANTSLALVTGAAGYLGSWCIKLLLESGYQVNGTVRSLQATAKIRHLLDLQTQFPNQLRLFEADLLKEKSFDLAAENVEIIFHVASPYTLAQVADPQREIVEPAVLGTRNILETANRQPTVRKVFMVSSMVAMFSSLKEVYALPSHTLTEQYWNRSNTIDEDPYPYSKATAERLAWDICQQQSRWQLVTLAPGAIFGPSLSSRQDGESTKMIIQFLNGSFSSGVPALHLGVVDVRDVARALISAAEHPQANGRYLIISRTCSLLQLAGMIAGQFPEFRPVLPKKELPKWLMWLIGPLVGLRRNYIRDNVGYAISFDTNRSQTELGMKYREPTLMMKDHITQLKQDKLVTPPQQP